LIHFMHWKILVESNLNELHDRLTEFMQLPDDADKARLVFYTKLMMAYFRQDIDRLIELRSEAESNFCDSPYLLALADIRFLICTAVNEEKLKHHAQNISNYSSDAFIQAELHYVVAIAFQKLDLYSEAESSFLTSSLYFEQTQVFKKSLRARLSSIASYSHRKPQARLFSEYFAVHRKAIDVDDFQSASVALINISRELQLLNVLSTAIDYASQAVAFCEAHHHGKREHGLALLQRAHLYFEMQRPHDAEKDLYHSMMIQHTEVQSATKILAEKYNVKVETLQSQSILPTWNLRAKSSDLNLNLGKLESQVLNLLSQKPRSKNELIENLYDDKIDYFSREARLKNLLARIRKRFPGLIVLDDDIYRMTDPESEDLLLYKKERLG
jgi:hypothetical protein